MPYTAFTCAIFGPSKAGLTTAGYRLFNADGTANGSRIAAGVTERSPGTYGATITFPDAFVGEVRWDTGGGTPSYASAPVNAGDSLTVSSGKVDVNDKTGFSLSSAAIDAIWAALTAGMTAIGSIGRFLTSGNIGAGAYVVSITVNDGSAPIQNASVRITQGITTLAGTTNASGIVSFALDAATYTLAITKAGYQLAPASLDVSGTASITRTMAPTVAILAPADPSQITGFLTTRNAQGAVQPHASITFQLVTAPGTDSYKTAPFTVKSDATGILQVPLRLSATYRAKRAGGEWTPVTVPSSGASFSLPQILGDS